MTALAVVAAFMVLASIAAGLLGRRHLRSRTERFANAPSAAGAATKKKGPTDGGGASAQLLAKLKTFTSQERELFQNLQDNKYTTNQIDDLIQTGVLNSKVVDKFLAALNVL